MSLIKCTKYNYPKINVKIQVPKLNLWKNKSLIKCVQNQVYKIKCKTSIFSQIKSVNNEKVNKLNQRELNIIKQNLIEINIIQHIIVQLNTI